MMIRRFTKSEISKLKERFHKGQPFQHVVIENFLTNPEQILRALEKEKFLLKDTDLFSFKQTNNLYFSKIAGVKKAVSTLSSEEFADIVGEISGLKLKPGAIDVFGALYDKTNYLLCHDDRLEGRKIAFVLYLSESFGKKDGGSLVLLSSNAKHPVRKVVAYPPLENSLVIFKVSTKSWHEVEEVLSDRKRYTIGGWLH